MDAYRELLGRVDAWYRGVREAHSDKVPCGRGCRDCCLVLFDISLADRDLLREGLAKADEATRRDIERRSREVLSRLRERFPDLGDTLDGWPADDIDDLCDALDPVECPVLGPQGECRLYEHRPLVCRLTGLPLVDRTGVVVHAEGCGKCELRPEETPPFDCEGMRRDERRLLRKRHSGRSGVTLLIPQALEPPTGAG